MHDFLGGFELILRGGFMMYPLLLAGLIALTVIMEKIYTFHRRYNTPPEFLGKVLNLMRSGDFSGADNLCKGLNAPIASVLLSGIEHFENPVEEMELAMKNRAEEWVPLLEKRIDIIDTVITAAPLMGLLGTITGMMASFRVLSEKGVNEPNAITGGVAEALIAPGTGLVIALICLVAYNYLSTRVKEFIYEIESAASRLQEVRNIRQRTAKGKSQ